MPNIQNELSLLIDPNKNDLLGILGITENAIESDSRPGYVWVRLLDNLSEAILAYNRKVTPVFDLPVVLSFDGVKYEVQGIDANRYSDWVGGQAYLPKHGNQHSAMYGASGSDIVWVDQQQFLPLLPTPGGSVTGTNQVFVAPYVFKNSKGQWIYAGNTGVTIPPSTMATGSQMYLLYMRDSDGVLYTKAGTPFAAQITGTAGFMPYLPGGINNNNDIPILAIRRNGINSGSPIGWENILDVRQFYKGYVPASTGTSYLETISIMRSGVVVGDMRGIDFYGNYTITKVGENAKVVDNNIDRVTTDTSLAGLGTLASPLRALFTGSAAGNPIGVIEADGVPSGTPINTFVFPNNSLSVSGTNAFVAFPMTGVLRSGTTTDGHLAVWDGTNLDSIRDGGVVPTGGGSGTASISPALYIFMNTNFR